MIYMYVYTQGRGLTPQLVKMQMTTITVCEVHCMYMYVHVHVQHRQYYLWCVVTDCYKVHM